MLLDVMLLSCRPTARELIPVSIQSSVGLVIRELTGRHRMVNAVNDKESQEAEVRQFRLRKAREELAMLFDNG